MGRRRRCTCCIFMLVGAARVPRHRAPTLLRRCDGIDLAEARELRVQGKSTNAQPTPAPPTQRSTVAPLSPPPSRPTGATLRDRCLSPALSQGRRGWSHGPVAHRSGPGGRAPDVHWHAMFSQQVAWTEERGSPWVPRSEGPLGRWVVTQGVAYRQGRLPPDRARLLESLPDWQWERRRSQPDLSVWWDRFATLQSWVAEVACTKELPTGRLRSWVGDSGALRPEAG